MNKRFLIIIVFVLTSVVAMSNDNYNVTNTTINSILATVNGTPIFLSEVIEETQAEEKLLVTALEPQKAKEAVIQLRRKVVEDMVERRVILDEYESNPFPIEDSYISDFIDNIARNTGIRSRQEFYKNLRAANINVDEFKAKIKERIIIQFTLGRLTYNQVNISPKKIYEYYKKNTVDKSEKYFISLIFLDKNGENYQTKKEKLAELLKLNQENFHILAGEYSDLNYSKENNGAVGSFILEDIRAEFKEFVENNKNSCGIISNPIETDEGTYYITIDKVERDKVPTLKEQELEIRAKLEEIEKENITRNYIEKLKNNAVIEYFF